VSFVACSSDHAGNLVAASDEEARRSIDHHYKVFENLLELANNALQTRQYKGAVVYAQIGAHYAWSNHPGILASYKLEQVIRTAGVKATQGSRLPQGPHSHTGHPARVLHVLSEAHPTGGHTRLVWRWIQHDGERSHSVIVTNQGELAAPHALEDATHASGGKVYLLDQWTRDIFSRARLLRDLASSTDQVVLHIHPYDVLPIIAFADREGLPPVTLLNHADHVFWVGASISDVVAHYRHSGCRLSQNRRGIARERCAFIPIPVISSKRTFSQPQAKELIGLSSTTPVLLSIGWPYKYTPVNGLSFAEILTSVIEDNKEAILLVIGPNNEGVWAEATRRTRGRIRTLGWQAELTIFYQAADIFVDSFPLCSETALLEAATYGVVPASYCPYSPQAEILCTDVPSIEPNLFCARTLDEYKTLLSHLIEDAPFRSALGERIRQAVLEVHCGNAWRRFPQEVYLRAASVASVDRLTGWAGSSDCPSFSELDRVLERLHTKGGFSRGFDENFQSHLRLLPPHLRIWLLGKMFEGGRALDPARFEATISAIASGKSRC
jgi:hypothetical protein